MISTVQTQYRNYIDFKHNLEMIMALHTQYNDVIDSTYNLEMILALHIQNIVIIMTIIQNV